MTRHKMAQIVPAILSATKKDALGKLKRVKGIVKRVQFDFMDGKFVPQKTVLPKQLPNLKTKMHLEAHLMMREPAKQAVTVAKRGFKTAIFHYEACKTKQEVLNTMAAFRSAGLKVGIAINPETSAQKLKPFAKITDLFLVMLVRPGKMGQSLLCDCFKKISQIKKFSKAVVEVDGGINKKTISRAVKEGAGLLVAGSAVFGEKNIKKAVRELKEAIKK